MVARRGRRARGPVSWLALAILVLMTAWLAALQPGPSAAARVSPLQSAIRMPQTSRIAIENALPGTDEWASIGNYDVNSLQAFAGATSVNAGGSINIHVKSTGSTLSARLYRLGYYHDHGARLYATYSNIPTPAQPNCDLDNSTGLVSCPWSPTFTINTDPNWISGFYLVRLDSNNGYRSFVYFIVRNDGYSSDILVMEPTKTNQAYNRYGGESLYYKDPSHGGTRVRAYKVSFDRPYLSGAGTGSVFAHDLEMVRWLEASGYDVSYISDVDRAANPGLLLSHPVFMVEGHDEYWSWGERDAMEAARDAGVNLIFASANESYWRVRLEDSAVGPNRIITCYKDADLDPSPDKTITFRELNRPENSLVGTGYQSYYDETQYGYPWVPYAPASSWYFDCTGFQPGDQVNNIVGEEWDALLNNGYTPPGVEVMARGNMSDPHGDPLLHESTIYTATGGARVFAAGSIFFSWGLIDHSYANQVFEPAYQSNAADPRIEQMMANIIDRFAGYWNGQPRSCAGQTFYKVGSRPTRTPMPQVPTATRSPATATPTFTFTPVRTATATNTPVVTYTPTRTATSSNTPSNTPSSTPTNSTTPSRTVTVTGTPSNVPTRTATSGATATRIITPSTTRTLTSTVTPTTPPSNTITPTRTGTPTITPSNTPTANITPTQTDTPSGTPSSTRTYTPTGIPSGTPTTPSTTPTRTATTTATPTGTISLPSTETVTSTPSMTETPTSTSTPATTLTSTPTRTPPGYPSSTSTTSATATATNTATPLRTATPSMTSVAELTPAPTFTQTAIAAPTATSTPLEVNFADVPAGSAFYAYIQWIASHGYARGYDCGSPGEPCPGHYFRASANVTRGQLLKMVVNAAGWTLLNPADPTFEDVLRDSTFYLYVETAYGHAVIRGYPCGGVGEPCGIVRRPYFRPNNNVTRGQLSKVVTLTAGYPLPNPNPPTFADVPASHIFFPFIEAIYAHGVINGYACGGPEEPCDHALRPYFRPANSATRGQISKVVAITSGGP